MPDRVIGRETERDPNSIALATREGQRIPNEQLPEWDPASMAAAIEIVEESTENVRLRSASATYNCVGMTFANRRTKIEPQHLRRILNEDGYRRVYDRTRVMPGDVVLYGGEEGDEPDHVGLVANVHDDLEEVTREIWVLSQFGREGEYLHEESDVPAGCDGPISYYTERRLLDD